MKMGVERDENRLEENVYHSLAAAVPEFQPCAAAGLPAVFIAVALFFLLRVTNWLAKSMQIRACSLIEIQLCFAAQTLQGKAEKGRQGDIKKLQHMSGICNVIYVF